MVDLELLSAELQCQIEKYKLEKMNLQQSVKTLSRQEERLSRTSLTERRKSPGRLYDLLADKNSSFHLTKSRLSSDDIQSLKIRWERNNIFLREHYLFSRGEGVGLEMGGERVVEMGGVDVLSIKETDWSSLNTQLRPPVAVVTVRKVSPDTNIK